MDFTNIRVIIAVIFFIIVIVFSTVKITYKTGNNNAKNSVPIDLLDNRTDTGLQQGISANNYNNNDNNSNANNMNNMDNMNNNSMSNNTKTVKSKKVSGYNPNANNNDLWGLPEKDQYMTPIFREQIDNLKDRYYTTGNFANV
jgi:hypothetical protein